jgi:hypothetical protein
MELDRNAFSEVFMILLLHLHAREKTVDLPTSVAVPQSRLSLLIMFTWYRVLQAEEDAASAAMVG